VDDASKKKPSQLPSDGKEPERRRVSTIVHDDRGNASVRWHDAPPDEQRQVLEILDEPKLSVKNEEKSYDPYSQRNAREGGSTGRTTRTDLRKLSEWIKMMRELEERKKQGGGNGDE
jgi:hypothetical protein